MTLVFDVVVGAVLPSLVLDDPLLAVGLQEGVNPFGVVVVPRLPLTLDVVVFQIVDRVIIVVVGRRLNETLTTFHQSVAFFITW